MHEITEYLTHQHGILQGITYDQGNYFTTKEVNQWPPAHAVNWSSHVSHHHQRREQLPEDSVITGKIQIHEGM